MGSDGTLPSAPEINATKSDSGNDTVMHTTSTITKPYPHGLHNTIQFGYA